MTHEWETKLGPGLDRDPLQDKQEESAIASNYGLGIDKRKLREKITEIVGARVYSMREIMSGKYPGEYDISKWREEYICKQNLPPYVIELNHFRTEVDEFTAMIMQAVADRPANALADQLTMEEKMTENEKREKGNDGLPVEIERLIMTKIYLITSKANGPAGHGEPGCKYITLTTDGNGYELGNPYPAFSSFDAAESKRKEIDRWDFCEVTELRVES